MYFNTLSKIQILNFNWKTLISESFQIYPLLSLPSISFYSAIFLLNNLFFSKLLLINNLFHLSFALISFFLTNYMPLGFFSSSFLLINLYLLSSILLLVFSIYQAFSTSFFRQKSLISLFIVSGQQVFRSSTFSSHYSYNTTLFSNLLPVSIQPLVDNIQSFVSSIFWVLIS